MHALAVPPMIGVGDTARITMQYLNASGGCDNFPDDQQYEVGMAEGCVWGDILAKPSGGEFSKNNYFASVVNPIMFVAADSLEDDGGSVKLNIGIVESLSAKVKHKTIDTSLQRIKAELEKFYAAKRGNNFTGVKKVQDVSCYNGDLDCEKKIRAALYVKEKCGDYEKYDEKNYILNYEIVYHKNHFLWKKDVLDMSAQYFDICNGDDQDQNGGSNPIPYTWVQEVGNGYYVRAWDIKPLYEFSSPDCKEWLHFMLVDPQNPNIPVKLKFDAIVDLCDAKIADDFRNRNVVPVFINSVAEIPEQIAIGDRQELKRARNDFNGYYQEPNDYDKYVLTEVIVAHEKEHIAEYITIIKSKFSTLLDEIKNYKVECRTYNDTVKAEVMKNIKKIVEHFVENRMKELNIVNKNNRVVMANYEQVLQERNTVKDIIDKYIRKIDSISK